MKHPKIVIVGAGPSGIAAATKLFENGFNNVKILEAEDRIGGRVHTVKIGNYSVDLGGEWVHGEKGNLAFELAYPLGYLERTGKHHYEKSQLLLDSRGNSVSDDVKNGIVDFYYKYIDGIKADNNTNAESYGEYIEKMFVKEFKNNPNIFSGKNKFLNHLELFVITMESAESWHDVSIDDDGFEGFPGDGMICWKSEGYSTILDILMKKIPDPNKELPVIKHVYLNNEVQLIDYSNNSIESPIIVKTNKGLSYEADHVIVTVPLGVLKNNYETLFTPSLPEYKVKTIKSLGYGSIAKIFLLFDKPFWNSKDKFPISFLWNETDRKSIENNPDKRWILGMLGIMPVDNRPNLLTMLISGEYAKAMEFVPDDQFLSHTMENLHRFLGKIFKVTEPKAILRTRWYTNPHFKGTFTYRSTEAQKEKVTAEMLERPINPEKLTILFAGEATSTNRFSTVDGAVLSGFKAADRLINYYKKVLSK